MAIVARARTVVGLFALALGLFTLTLGGACFVDLPSDRQPIDPCDVVTCSVNGYCQAAECHCDPGFVGNPDALHGCQPSGTRSPCATTCGLNAWCDTNECVCEDGFVAVCGTGDCTSVGRLCDGTDDCVNAADEDPLVCFDGAVQPWSLVDDCDDGEDIAFRIWAQDRDWVWPSIDAEFHTAGEGETSRESIECLDGELICFGGEAGDRQWGIGLDGQGSCEDCCQPCSSDVVEIGALTCG
jgi:hypothetical protein